MPIKLFTILFAAFLGLPEEVTHEAKKKQYHDPPEIPNKKSHHIYSK